MNNNRCLTIAADTFGETIVAAPLALVDFWAPWCGPCRMVGPVIEALAAEYDGRAVIGKLNVDENQAVAAQYGVMSIPTVILFKNGVEAERMVGVKSQAAYAAVLDVHLA